MVPYDAGNEDDGNYGYDDEESYDYNYDMNLTLMAYRSPKYLVTNLVMNLVTNLVITKLGEEFGDIFVTLFGDSPNWVMILMTFSSPHLVGHQIG